ncbi:MAG: fimbrillin family protein [Rikenellaceae bacterium]|nr:fimbrillin family protein [Rikenellaceae bacterium]
MVKLTPVSPLMSNIISGTTRVAGTSWASNDRVGFMMVRDGKTVNGNNVMMTAKPSGALTFNSTVYYPSDKGKVDMVGYYPYTATATYNNGVEFDAGATEVLYAKAIGVSYRDDEQITLEFTPALARINFVVVVTTPGAATADMTAKLQGVKTKGTLSLVTGNATATGEIGTVPIVRVGETGNTIYFAAFLPPVEVEQGDVQLILSSGDQEFTVEVAPDNYEAGYIYNRTCSVAGVAPIPVDYILYNGVKWAKTNLSATGTFAATAYEMGASFFGDSTDPCPTGWHTAKRSEWNTVFVNGGQTTPQDQAVPGLANRLDYSGDTYFTPTATTPLTADSWETTLTLHITDGLYRLTNDVGTELYNNLAVPTSWDFGGHWQYWGDNSTNLPEYVRCVKD